MSNKTHRKTIEGPLPNQWEPENVPYDFDFSKLVLSPVVAAQALKNLKKSTTNEMEDEEFFTPEDAELIDFDPLDPFGTDNPLTFKKPTPKAVKTKTPKAVKTQTPKAVKKQTPKAVKKQTPKHKGPGPLHNEDDDKDEDDELSDIDDDSDTDSEDDDSSPHTSDISSEEESEEESEDEDSKEDDERPSSNEDSEDESEEDTDETTDDSSDESDDSEDSEDSDVSESSDGSEDSEPTDDDDEIGTEEDTTDTDDSDDEDDDDDEDEDDKEEQNMDADDDKYSKSPLEDLDNIKKNFSGVKARGLGQRVDIPSAPDIVRNLAESMAPKNSLGVLPAVSAALLGGAMAYFPTATRSLISSFLPQSTSSKEISLSAESRNVRPFSYLPPNPDVSPLFSGWFQQSHGLKKAK